MTPEAMEATMVLMGWEHLGVTWVKRKPSAIFGKVDFNWCVVVTWEYTIVKQRYPREPRPAKHIDPQRTANIFAKVMEYEEHFAT